jgi:hypothetical protein
VDAAALRGQQRHLDGHDVAAHQRLTGARALLGCRLAHAGEHAAHVVGPEFFDGGLQRGLELCVDRLGAGEHGSVGQPRLHHHHIAGQHGEEVERELAAGDVTDGEHEARQRHRRGDVARTVEHA